MKKAPTSEQLERGFFGRKAGKTLKGRQAELMDEFAAHPFSIQTGNPAPLDISALFQAPVSSVWMESGFGGGEHLIHRVTENPDTGFIGVEPFRNGMAKAIVALDKGKFQNVRLYNEEAGPFLSWLPAHCLDGFYLLYPDPWPKKRHFKRRFINQENLDRLERVLKPGAPFRFASDIDSYIDWTLCLCAGHSSFTFHEETERDIFTPWDNWPGTRYEAKALREGRIPRYLTFLRA